ncbi:hypothetical protein AAE478_002446 [Parahypoxylon ruwenzoriense]
MDSTPSTQPPPSFGSGPLRIPELTGLSSSSFTAANSNDHAVESGDVVVVDSPISPASPNALARFEFEAGRGNDGSKILMVEWDPTPSGEDGWVVTWEGKATTFPVAEKVEPEDEVGKMKGGDEEEKQRQRQRIYFLLPSDATVPPAVTITHAGSGRVLMARSMPAIFAPGLGVGTRDAGRRGVLHTVWARLRAAQLQDEIRRELRDNSESVGLEMAVQERLWIIDHFGLDDLLAEANAAADADHRIAAAAAHPQPPTSPQSPRSPIGGRLGEKLKGLKLATSPAELANPLGTHFSLQQQLGAPESRPLSQPQPGLRANTGAAGVASLDALLGSGGNEQQAAAPPATQSKETEDELFALPMSPRSPEMKTSPFSFLK